MTARPDSAAESRRRAPAASPSVATIGQFFSVLRRRWPVVLIPVLVCLLIASRLLLWTPKTYESDAVVQVTPATMNVLLTQHESDDTKLRPAVQKVLEPDLPPGPFRTGVELNILFGADRRTSRVFLDPPRNTVVLQSSSMAG